MVKVAVAGGAGNVGQTIVEALLAHGNHQVVILSRRDHEPQNGVTFFQVNYNDVDSTAKTLEDANIHTVICAFGMASEEISSSQLRLIQAADKSAATFRFVVSGFDLRYTEEHVSLIPTAKWALDADRAVAETTLEHTRIVNGLFLDYYGMPQWKSHLHPWVNAVNVKAKWAAIPGDGSAKVSFITSQDMATFTTRLMDLDTWSPVSSIIGNVASFQDILDLAEKARGEKFSVKYDSIHDLRNGKISFPDFLGTGLEDTGVSTESVLARFHYISGTGGYLVQTDDPLDAKFPDVKITTPADVIESSWTTMI